MIYENVSFVRRPDRPNPPRPPGGGLRHEPRFYLGVDLGQVRDHSALALVERAQPAGPREWSAHPPATYHVGHLERIPLGTPYPEIVAGLAAWMGAPPLAGDTALLADGAGVGRGVLDLMVREGLRPIAVTATGGMRVTSGGPLQANVPKQDLVTGLQVLFQAKRLKIAAALPHARTLLEELGAFRVQTTASGNHRFGARAGEHDDLVFALALACWFAERRNRVRPQPSLPPVSRQEEAAPSSRRAAITNHDLLERLERQRR